MSDLLSGAQTSQGQGGLGLGIMKYLSQIQSNRNARAQNATNDKWGPLLALNRSKGAANIEVPSASFANTMGPAMVSAMNAGAKAASGMPMGGGGGEGGVDPSQLAKQFPGLFGQEAMESAGYAGGGMPMHGKVPGRAMVPGDSPLNDTKLTPTSPGEVVLPRTVAQDGMKGNKWKVAAYLNEVKKHGPGPMPIKAPKSGVKQDRAKSSSMSPWEAMACGGMTR